MDNVTHTLTGLALARAGLNRYSPHAVALLIVSANAPDIDIVAAANGSLAYLEAHRGYTHSLIGLPVMAAISMLFVAALFRKKLPWGKAWVVCAAGLGSHLLLDWTNSYGTRLLLPFSSRWCHLDTTALYDGWIMAVLLLAAIWPVFARLVSREIGGRESAGRGMAIFALLFFLSFDCARGVLHQRAVAQMESRMFENAPPVSVAALPTAFNPFQWHGMVETASAYEVIPVSTLSDLDVTAAQVFFKPPVDPAIESAKRAEPFRYFEYFARFPVWSESRITLDDGGDGMRVELADLRFGQPQRGSMHCIAVENTAFQVVHEWFTFGSGFDLGWGKNGPPTTEQQ
jgi:inner membrane protein